MASNTPPAARAGTITIGGSQTVYRTGFGAMRFTGRGIWGEPEDPAGCRRVLRRAMELGVDFFDTARPSGALDKVARQHGATPGQVALAWLLARSRQMLPIPGTSRVAHLEENVAAAGIELDSSEVEALAG
jgi:aryl-alcohol dehydrogenase-like predicted oxidoreductase